MGRFPNPFRTPIRGLPPEAQAQLAKNFSLDVATQAELTAAINGIVAGTVVSVVTVNTNTTIAASDEVVMVTGGVTITLPAVPASGEIHDIKDAAGTAGASNITVAGNGKNIDGAASQLITSNYESMRVVYSGSAWARI